MHWKGRFRNGLLALVLAGLIAPEANAVEIFTGANAAGHMGDGLVTLAQVRVRSGGARHGGPHRGGVHTGAMHGGARYPGGAHRGAAHVNVNRNIRRNATRNVNRNVHRYGYRGGYAGRRGAAVWAGRPGWYSWAPGGAVAAGAALGFVTAATATAWAGAPPEPDLCWYYTDPSRRQGFWDVCF
jgi:hypothetical protein